MANVMGALVVKLGLDAAEFTSGLTKAEYQSQKFAKQMDSQFKSIAQFIGSLGIGIYVTKFVKDTISAASGLDDLADSTGSTVEALSRLHNQVKISTGDATSLDMAILKLSAGMAGAEDGSAGVGRALKALGITTRDPAEAINQIAVELDKYKDGVEKAAIASDLFGKKQGPAYLAILKDIARNQDVVATTTAKQTEEAEKLEQAWRRLSVEGVALKNMLLNDLVPAATKLTEQFTQGKNIAGGFWEGLRLFGSLPLVDSVEDAMDALTKLNKRIQEIEAGKGLEGLTARITGQTARIVEDLKKQRAFLELQLRQQIDAAPGKKGGDDLTVKPTLPYTGLDDNQVAKIDARLKAVDRYVKSEEELFKDRQHFLDQYYDDDVISISTYFSQRQKALDAAIELERVAFSEREKILKSFEPANEKERIANEEKLRDAIEKKAKAEREYVNLSADGALAQERAVKAFQQSIDQLAVTLKAARGDTVGAGLAGFDLQYSKLRDKLKTEGRSTADLDELRKRTADQLQLTKATQEYNLTLDELAVAQQRINTAADSGSISELETLRQRSAATDSYISKLRVELAAVEAIALASGKREDAVRVLQLKAQLESLADQTDLVAKKMNDGLGRAFSDNLLAVLDGTKSLREGIKGLEKDIIHMLNEVAVNELKTALFGKGGAASGAGSFLAWLMGGGSSSGTSSGWTSGYDLPIGANAMGTDFWRGGPTKVGEFGTEIVNIPRGAQIIPNSELVARREMRGGDINVTVSMPRGANTQTGAQFGAAAARGIQQSFGRNG